MRVITIAEGRGQVEVHKGCADVRLDGHYVGRLTRLGNGRWRDLARPHLSFAGPGEGGQDVADTLDAQASAAQAGLDAFTALERV